MNTTDMATYKSNLFLNTNKTYTTQYILKKNPSTYNTQYISKQTLFSMEYNKCFNKHFKCITKHYNETYFLKPKPVLCTPYVFKLYNHALTKYSKLPIPIPIHDNPT